MNLSNGEPPKVTFLAPLIRERKQKACKCKDRRFCIDLTNRTVECSVCGQFIDPFEALCEIAERNDRYDYYLKGRGEYAEELNKWFKNHKEPLTLKKLIENYRGGMIPLCPKCGEVFDFTEITTWTAGDFYKKRLQEQTNEK